MVDKINYAKMITKIRKNFLQSLTCISVWKVLIENVVDLDH